MCIVGGTLETWTARTFIISKETYRAWKMVLDKGVCKNHQRKVSKNIYFYNFNNLLKTISFNYNFYK